MISSHPKANQLLQTADGGIAYELQRKKRKTLGLYVQPEGVIVRAPLWATQKVIDAFLNEKQSWLFKKIKEQGQKKKTITCIQWQHGCTHQHFGLPIALQVNTTQGRGKVALYGGYLAIGLPDNGRQPSALPQQMQISRLVQTWQKKTAQAYYEQQVKHYADLMKVMPQHIALTSAKTRWGSANTKGVVRLHWRLVELSPEVADYVIVHELAHLKEMNHSEQFWREVEVVLPNYRETRKMLKGATLPLWNV